MLLCLYLCGNYGSPRGAEAQEVKEETNFHFIRTALAGTRLDLLDCPHGNLRLEGQDLEVTCTCVA